MITCGAVTVRLYSLVMTRLAACVLVFLLSISAAFADLSGQVIGILDGHTIEVLQNNHTERIRLNSIDCPEKGQARGKRVKQAASELVFGKQVTLLAHGFDEDGRTIADVLLLGGTNVNQELVKEGWCWWYRQYAPGNLILEELERRARGSGLGLWADPAPIPPWGWRKARLESLAEVNQ